MSGVLLGVVLVLVATLAVPRDGEPQMGGTPPQGAPNQAQGALAEPPFDLKDRAVIKEGATLFATTCSYCHKGHPGAAGVGVPTLRDQTYDKEYLYKVISDGPGAALGSGCDARGDAEWNGTTPLREP
jgi:mono/diheme cytochrome c family protein